MTSDDEQLLREFRAEIPAPDDETRRRIYTHATSEGNTRLRGRHWRLPSFVLAGGVAAAVIAVLLVSPWSGSGGLVQRALAQRALAAVGTGPVLHVVTEQPEPGPIQWYQPVSLPSGTPIPVTWRQEIWFDQSRDLNKTVTSENGFVISQLLETSQGDFDANGPYQNQNMRLYPANTPYKGPPPSLEPALAGFIDHYQSALASGQATTTGTGQVDGHDVIWLRVAAEPKDYLPAEDVAIDASTYAPVQVRTDDPNSVQFTVTQIDRQAYDPSLFTHPTVEYPSVSSTTNATTAIDATQAPSVLGGQALWLGQAWNGYQLAKVEEQPLVYGYSSQSAKQPTQSVGVIFTYTPPGGSADSPHVLQITESQQCEWGLHMSCTPPPAQGVLSLGHDLFASTTVRDGLYVAINQNGSQSDPVAVANALQPLTVGTK